MLTSTQFSWGTTLISLFYFPVKQKWALKNYFFQPYFRIIFLRLDFSEMTVFILKWEEVDKEVDKDMLLVFGHRSLIKTRDFKIWYGSAVTAADSENHFRWRHDARTSTAFPP